MENKLKMTDLILKGLLVVLWAVSLYLTAENNQILRERDFDRIHREHADLMEKCR